MPPVRPVSPASASRLLCLCPSRRHDASAARYRPLRLAAPAPPRSVVLLVLQVAIPAIRAADGVVWRSTRAARPAGSRRVSVVAKRKMFGRLLIVLAELVIWIGLYSASAEPSGRTAMDPLPPPAQSGRLSPHHNTPAGIVTVGRITYISRDIACGCWKQVRRRRSDQSNGAESRGAGAVARVVVQNRVLRGDVQN